LANVEGLDCSSVIELVYVNNVGIDTLLGPFYKIKSR
jgi:hypothetical protein